MRSPSPRVVPSPPLAPSPSRVDALAEALVKLAPRSLATRLEQLRRDVNVLVQGFAGSHPPPLIPRAPRLATSQRSAEVEPSTSTASQAPGVVRHMAITALAHETQDALTLTLSDVRGEAIRFQAGQFLLLRVDLNGETLWRAYSICTAPGDARIAVTVKRVADGRVSNYLHEHAKVGQVLEIRGPSGRFTLEPAEGARQLILLAGGSGITPLMSHVRHWLATEPTTKIMLLYGSRRASDIIFRDALDALAQAHPNRFRVRHVLDHVSDGEFGQGPLDEAALTRELERLAPAHDEDTRYLVCGPAPMMQACRSVLERRGVADLQVRQERFFGVAAPSDSTAFHAQDVRLKLPSGESTTRVEAGETILQAALRTGAPLNYSCAMGGCGACMAVLVEGDVHMSEPNCLTKRERQAGKILSCIAQPLSACRVEQLP